MSESDSKSEKPVASGDSPSSRPRFFPREFASLGSASSLFALEHEGITADVKEESTEEVEEEVEVVEEVEEEEEAEEVEEAEEAEEVEEVEEEGEEGAVCEVLTGERSSAFRLPRAEGWAVGTSEYLAFCNLGFTFSFSTFNISRV